ncbi:MAG: GIY-YIG nuclease family protein [Sedimentisphaerales bacterium]|nr:GIY-YIG nuclease family protein [Sedimentisphaerales bacterium]
MYYVYILQSLKTGKLYIGHTDNLIRRLKEHNTGCGGKFSRQNGPWKLLYSESHADRPSAVKRERYLKSTRGSQEKKKLAGVFEVKYKPTDER